MCNMRATIHGLPQLRSNRPTLLTELSTVHCTLPERRAYSFAIMSILMHPNTQKSNQLQQPSDVIDLNLEQLIGLVVLW